MTDVPPAGLASEALSPAALSPAVLSLTAKVALGATMLGATAGVVGAFAVLRRRSLIGDVLAHAALPGIAIAYIVTGSRDLLSLSSGALLTGVLGVLVIVAVCRWTRTREDAAMGIVLSTFFGAGIVLLTVIQSRPDGGQAGLDGYLFGEIASLRNSDIQAIAVVGLVMTLLVAVLHKEMKVMSFDPGFAATQGWPTFWLDLGMMAAVAVVTIVGLPVCGVVLMAAMLIFPCTSARYWTNRLGLVLLGSAAVGGAAAGLGVLASSPAVGEAGWLSAILRGASGKSPPPGPMIVLVGAGFFLVSLLFAPRRGAVARWWRQAWLRGEIVRDHVLRLLFEMSEPHLPELPAIAAAEINGRISADTPTRVWVLRRMAAAGLVDRSEQDLRLTTTGYAEAARVTRAHRLWEQFLISHADIAADHVHNAADDIEHVLPEEIVDRLEEELAAERRLPTNVFAAVPESPHEPAPTNPARN